MRTPSQQPKGQPLSVRLDFDLRADLEKLAIAEDRSLSNYVARVLRTHVEARKKRAKVED